MFRARWLGSILETRSSRKNLRRLAAQKRKPIRLMLESLEERLTPSGGNPTVTQTAGGYADLTAAVAADTAANTNYVIQITNSFTFDSGGQVSISKLGSGSTLTLSGQNGTNYTLTGNGNRLFDIASGQSVTFADLTLTGGSVTNSKGNAQGGAILDQGGNVTLSKVIVQGNTVTGAAAISVTGATAAGGGVYASGAGTLTIRDSILSDNRAQGGRGADGATASHGYPYLLNGSTGGSASGGGLYVGGSGWTVTLIGDTFAGNTARGGNGGNGSRGANVPPAPPLQDVGDGGYGGWGGGAEGGAAFFSDSGSTANTQLTILDDPAAPTAYPSLFVDNTAQAGAGGNGGDGGTATGTANNFPGGYGGDGGSAEGGALVVTGYHRTPPPPPPSPAPQAPTDPSDYSIPFTVGIGNTTFYGNTVYGSQGGQGGAAGSGGSGKPGAPGGIGIGGGASGGGLYLDVDNPTTVFNCTVANNAAAALGTGPDGYSTPALGGGISAYGSVTCDNNTITQNTVTGSNVVKGSGIVADSSSFYGAVNLFNNIIQGNRSIGSPAFDLDTEFDIYGYHPISASNNFIATMSPNAVSTSTNIVGHTQVQLGNVVGVDASGKPSGGPIYYPLLSGTFSIGAGTTSALNTIADVEGTTSTNATDEIGNLRSSNGSINLGAVQTVTPISSYALVLTYDPASQAVYAGGAVRFTASASGNPTPTVQWQVSTDGGKSWSNISGATSTTLTLDDVSLAMNGNEYQAVFTNSSGSATTAAATLTVNPAPPPSPPSPPSPPAPPVLNVPPLLAFLDSLFRGIETVNANGTETMTDSFFGIPLIVSTFDTHGDLTSVDLFGLFNITFLFV